MQTRATPSSGECLEGGGSRASRPESAYPARAVRAWATDHRLRLESGRRGRSPDTGSHADSSPTGQALARGLLNLQPWGERHGRTDDSRVPGILNVERVMHITNHRCDPPAAWPCRRPQVNRSLPAPCPGVDRPTSLSHETFCTQSALFDGISSCLASTLSSKVDHRLAIPDSFACPYAHAA